MAIRRQRRVLPGFGLSLGYTLFYLSVIVLVPVAALVLATLPMSGEAFWQAVSAPRAVASYRLSIGASLVAACVNLVFGLLIAWVLVRYTFPGKKIVDALVDLPFALPTAVAGIALTALLAGNGWIGQYLEPRGIVLAFNPNGIVIALAIERFVWFGQACYPLIVLFQNVPKIALAPLLILWFGYDLLPKILLIVIMAFFPITLNMLVGLRSADANLVALFRSIGATSNQIMTHIKIPASLPMLIAGMKVAITLSVIGAIVGEFVGASAGLGYMIQFASSQMETALVFAALVQVSVMGVVFYYAIEALEWRLLRWARH